MKTIKTSITLLALLLSITFQSCKKDDDSSDDPADDPQTSCTTIANQDVQGSFRGEDFVSPEAYYKVFGAGGGSPMYSGTIFVKADTSDDCAFPTFEGNQDTISFPIPSLEPQTINLSDVAGNGDGTLNFNRVNMTTSEIELAECGTLEIISYDATAGEITGKVYAKGQEGSIVDGNFTLVLCEL